MGTLIATAVGHIAIEAIEAGDLVWATDTETGETALKEVVRLFRNETKEWIHITVNGETITCTPEHPFYSPVKGWTSAIDLRAGDILYGSDAYSGDPLIRKVYHMKNFDFKIYESMQYGADDTEWFEMMDKCHKDYLLCKSALSRKIVKWYENGWFHDAHLLKVESRYGKDGAWEINLVLQCRDDKYYNLSFHNVLDFRIHRAEEKNRRDNYEECLYAEFYRFDEKSKDIVMEFFTDEYTEFYIRFKKLTISGLKMR